MRSAIALAVIGMMAASTAARAEKREPVEKFRAFAVDLAGPYGASTALVQIDIERWSTPEELESLKAVFAESGEDALLDAVRDTRRVGSIRTTHTLGHDLRFAFQTALPDGARRIVIGTDRRTGFFETANRTRSLDYPYSLIELRVDADGKGQGRLIAAGRMMEFGERVEVENYGTIPVRLMQVKADR